MERKLAAIFSTDVKGYSRLMGEDEEATIATLKAYREVITRLIEQHYGRVVDSPGDNLLAEFASAVDAVKSAVAIQQELKTRNAELDEHRKMEFRIGLNVGDVITDEGRLYGDGVNIAARLEGLADPGGICLSGTVYDQIANKLEVLCTYQGEQSVKNIAQPVRAYRVQLELDSEDAWRGRAEQPAFHPHEAKRAARRWSIAAWAAGVVLVAVAIGAIRYGAFLFSSTQSLVPSTESLPLPDKPSIAVLPFTNMSDDPEQEYFSDGLTDTLITDLSKISALFVISRNSVFTYKGRTVKVEAVGKELGVRYVLESSVQKADGRVRINTQLIDTTTGQHVWAERYDRELQDLFTLQDEIAQKIVFALKVKLTPEEQQRFRRAPTKNLEAYDAYLRGNAHLLQRTKEANLLARKWFERAVALDPEYAGAYATLSSTYWLEWLDQWSPGSLPLDRAAELARKALTLNDTLPLVHRILGHVYQWQNRHEEAIAEAKQAIALDPNDADGYASLTEILSVAGRPAEAIAFAEQAMRLNPHYPYWYPFVLGNAYQMAGQYAEAIASLEQARLRNPNFLHVYNSLASSYVRQWVWQQTQDARALDRAEEAAQHAITLNDAMSWAHGDLSRAYLWHKRYEQAIAEARQAVALRPDGGDESAILGEVLTFAGQTEEALELMEKMLSHPSCLEPDHCFLTLGQAYYLAERYEQAIASLKRVFSYNRYDPRLRAHLYLAASFSELGREAEARAEISALLRVNPHFSLARVQQRWPYKNPAHLERFVAALRKAGLK